MHVKGKKWPRMDDLRKYNRERGERGAVTIG